MSSRHVMTYFPETRLSQLAARPGGIMRDIAVENATKDLESMRGEGDTAIAVLMTDIEAVLSGAKGGRFTIDQMQAILRAADQIVTLAGTFGYETLGRVMKSLCDITDGLIRSGQRDMAPVAVHVRSMRLVAPGGTQLSAEETETVLTELAKVLAHYKFSTIAAQSEGGVFAGR
jgi:hypothetical protein